MAKWDNIPLNPFLHYILTHNSSHGQLVYPDQWSHDYTTNIPALSLDYPGNIHDLSRITPLILATKKKL